MLFDPFIYHGMADMHDRHRDMRLDVDNMSYEVRKDKLFFHQQLLVTIPLILYDWDIRNYWHWKNALEM